jgi:hypothetical protein
VKTWNIEVQKIVSIDNSQGLIRARIDALVQAAASRDDAAPASVLSFSEDTARVLVLLLKAQLAQFDARKAKSRR